jgi:hypothetical protein
MGRLSPSVSRVCFPQPEPPPVAHREALSSAVSDVTVSHALRWHGCPARVHRSRLCRPSTGCRGCCPGHPRAPAVCERSADPAAAVAKHGTRLRRRSRPLRLGALALPEATTLRLAGSSPPPGGRKKPATASKPIGVMPCHWSGACAPGTAPPSLCPPSPLTPSAPCGGRGQRLGGSGRRPSDGAKLSGGGMISAIQGGPPGARPPCAGAARGAGPPPRCRLSCSSTSRAARPSRHGGGVAHSTSTSRGPRGAWLPWSRPSRLCGVSSAPSP